MMTRVRSLKKSSVLLSLALLIGLACRLPGAVAQRVAPEGTSTPTIALAGLATDHPATTTAASPEAAPEGRPSPTLPSVYPGEGMDEPVGSQEPGPIATTPLEPGLLESPVVTTLAPQPPELQPTSTEEVGTFPPTSGGSTNPGPGGAYPPEGNPPPVPPADTQPLLDGTGAPSPGGQPGGLPLRTPNAATAVFATQPPERQASDTPLPSPTRYFPPTPQPSATPTPTRTLIPAPPWVRVPLKATDPRTVKLASGKVQLVEFFAFWSGPSQAMAPLIKGLEDAYDTEVQFVFLDIDDPDVEPLMQLLRFRQEPHFFLVDGGGRVLRQWVGYVTVAEMQAAIEEALKE